jgi:hypothetical protein
MSTWIILTITRSCIPCPFHYYQGLSGHSICNRCEEGKKESNRLGAAYCISCTEGYWNNQTGTSCSTCLPGKYSDAPGATICNDCNIGTSARLSGHS